MLNFDGKMKLRVDFLKGSLAVNFEFWALTERYVKSWFFYKILTVNIEFWLKNEMKSCFLTGFLTVNIEFWRLSEMKSWRIWVWSVPFKKRIFLQFSSQIQLEKLISIFRQKSFNPGLLLTFVLWHRSFDFINELRNWLSALPDYVSSFSPFAKIVPILIYWLYRFKE